VSHADAARNYEVRYWANKQGAGDMYAMMLLTRDKAKDFSKGEEP